MIATKRPLARLLLVPVLVLGAFLVPAGAAAQSTSLVYIESAHATLGIDLAGGSIISFRLKSKDLNPLVWNDSGPAGKPRERGHFLCLDRWGPPSEAELANGMTFHGEATKVMWTARAVRTPGELTIEATLPMAGFHVVREFRLLPDAAVAVVRETVRNRNQLGRPYNMVQHPTIGPPFLDESVVVDSNARQGFMQSSPMPNPEQPTVVWPQALHDGAPVNLRRLTSGHEPNVVSFVIDEPQGWVTAANAGKGLLIGYSWDTAEYPWLNIWRHAPNGKPVARGLEFGTTGLHQPFPVLMRKRAIFDRPLLSYLDAGESQTRSYSMFLAEIGATYAGTGNVRVVKEAGSIAISIVERGAPAGRRALELRSALGQSQ